MRPLANIIRKELKELITPATILPIVFIAIIFGSIGTSMEGIQESFNEKPVIGFINEDNSNLSAIVASVLYNYSEVIFNSSDISDKTVGLEKLKQEDGIALIVINKNFSKQILNDKQAELEVFWIMRGAGILDTISSEVVEGLISSVNREISKNLIEDNTTVNATIALWPTYRTDTTYFKDREIPLSPGTISGVLSSQSMLIPIVIMMIIIMAGNMVITSMALEKENKTLETLLTLPVKRTSIVTGKIAASALIGLLFAIVYMFGMSRYLSGFNFGGSISVSDFDLTLTSSDFILIGVSLFITLTMLAMIPMFLTMFMDFDTMPLVLKGLLFAIPFSHPMMASRALIFDDYLLVFSGIIYVSIFAVIMIFLVVWIFKTDRLLTGTTSKRWKKIFKRRM